MLCYDIYQDHGIEEIVLCEETIRYSAYRSESIYLAATIVARLATEDPAFFYLMHSRLLDNLDVKVVGEDSDAAILPYSHIFSNIVQDRLQRIDDQQQRLRPFDDQNEISSDLPMIVDNINLHEGPGYEECIRLEDEEARQLAPYTCVKIGPLVAPSRHVIFRIEALLSPLSYSDLVEEDVSTGVRAYKVYGPDSVRTDIESLHLVQARHYHNSEAYEQHTEFLQNQLSLDKRLVPRNYSVVAVDNPNGSPSRLRAVSFTPNILKRTERVDDCVYQHHALDSEANHMHWFVTEGRASDFLLQLIGPIAKKEFCD